MKMLTKEIEDRLDRAGYYGVDNKDGQRLCQVKFFDSAGAGTWLIVGGERCDEYGGWIFYGKCNIGYGWEWGSVGLSQLTEINDRCGWYRIQREIFDSDGKHTVEELSY